MSGYTQQDLNYFIHAFPIRPLYEPAHRDYPDPDRRKILGELAERAGFPALIGEIGAGALLGPLIFNIVTPDETIEFFSDIGIIALLFISGAQINLQAFYKTEKAGLLLQRPDCGAIRHRYSTWPGDGI